MLTVDNLSGEDTTSATPEPATLLLIGSSLIVLAVHRYRKHPWHFLG
jgi:hypothetical protein